MRICVIGTRGFPSIEGGVEKHCEMLYPFLAGNAQIVVFRRKAYVTEHCEYKNIHFIDLMSTTIKGLETVIHSLLSVIHTIKMRPDVVHFHNIGPGMFIPLVKLFSIPVVLTYHSPNYEHRKWGIFAKILLRFSESLALRFADRVIFVNRFQMEKYAYKVRAKSEYIPNGILLPKSLNEKDYIETRGIKPGKYILSVGRITPEKGFHTLISAFKELGMEDVQLVIAGGVEHETGYMTQLQELSKGSNVIFIGFVKGETLAQLYSHAALFVLASENEGFPLVLLEAMGYQRDVLVSDIPGTRLVDLKEEDYFPVGDVAALTQGLRDKLQEERCRTYDLTGYDWQKIADRTFGVLREATQESRIKA